MLLHLDPAVRNGQMFGELWLGQPGLGYPILGIVWRHRGVDQSRREPRSQGACVGPRGLMGLGLWAVGSKACLLHLSWLTARTCWSGWTRVEPRRRFVDLAYVRDW